LRSQKVCPADAHEFLVKCTRSLVVVEVDYQDMVCARVGFRVVLQLSAPCFHLKERCRCDSERLGLCEITFECSVMKEHAHCVALLLMEITAADARSLKNTGAAVQRWYIKLLFNLEDVAEPLENWSRKLASGNGAIVSDGAVNYVCDRARPAVGGHKRVCFHTRETLVGMLVAIHLKGVDVVCKRI
jgi:hypothetical protein